MDTQTVQVVTDSSCDLPQDIVARLGIVVVPLVVHFGQETYLDGQVSLDEFWRRAEGPDKPKTSQPSVGAFEEAFAEVVARRQHALCITITSQHSGTYNAARLAAERFPGEVDVFDSLSLSLGQGLQVLAAAEQAHSGQPIEAILPTLADVRARTRVLIVLDTLESLRRGGRADAFIAVADRMTRRLNIKAVINMVDGQLRLMTAARSFDRAVERVLEVVADSGPLERLGVAHTRIPDAAANTADRLAERLGFTREYILVEEIGPALASHAGAGALGVLSITAAE